ncbi:hypothetical protein ARMSODRAFT_768489 [Armillaria solidipes]|uniref:Uncharacterized protein n=1 Tax=Armillaria solidipes TaxID=1076256 RepID=A0A2H3AM36_9AGAR|nr:hypothetical protein ARMSODRAFT_768489 [Armillaria solidipes]
MKPPLMVMVSLSLFPFLTYLCRLCALVPIFNETTRETVQLLALPLTLGTVFKWFLLYIVRYGLSYLGSNMDCPFAHKGMACTKRDTKLRDDDPEGAGSWAPWMATGIFTMFRNNVWQNHAASCIGDIPRPRGHLSRDSGVVLSL